MGTIFSANQEVEVSDELKQRRHLLLKQIRDSKLKLTTPLIPKKRKKKFQHVRKGV